MVWQGLWKISILKSTPERDRALGLLQAYWQPAVQMVMRIPTAGAARGEASGNSIVLHGSVDIPTCIGALVQHINVLHDYSVLSQNFSFRRGAIMSTHIRKEFI